MNVIVMIAGRGAIPVRAIPLLTYRETLSADVLAHALAGDEHFFYFNNLKAYYLEGGRPKELPQTYWGNIIRTKLKALSDEIGSREVSHDAGLHEWWKASVEALPPGVFVWREQFEPLYHMRFIDGMTTLTEEGVMDPVEQEKRARLDFHPFDTGGIERSFILEGFSRQMELANAGGWWMVDGGWWMEIMDARSWTEAESISPLHAAMLLARFNPNTTDADDAERSSSDEMEPQDFRRLKNVFEGADRSAKRTLKDWTEYARTRRLKVHSWISEWEEWLISQKPGLDLPAGLLTPGGKTETREQREDRRLKACIDAGLSMTSAFRRMPDGIGAIAKAEGVSRQAFTTDVRKALQRLQDVQREGRK